MTIEEAQARILELEGELETVKGERDSLSQNNDELSRDLENARKVNGRLLAKVAQQDAPEDQDKDDEPEIPTCEEFAKTINII